MNKKNQVVDWDVLDYYESPEWKEARKIGRKASAETINTFARSMGYKELYPSRYVKEEGIDHGNGTNKGIDDHIFRDKYGKILYEYHMRKLGEKIDQNAEKQESRGEESTIGDDTKIRYSISYDCINSNEQVVHGVKVKEIVMTGKDELQMLKGDYGFCRPSTLKELTKNDWFAGDIQINKDYDVMYYLHIHDVNGNTASKENMYDIARVLEVPLDYTRKDLTLAPMECIEHDELHYKDKREYTEYQKSLHDGIILGKNKEGVRAKITYNENLHCLSRERGEWIDVWSFRKDFNNKSADNFIRQWDEAIHLMGLENNHNEKEKRNVVRGGR